MNNRILTTHQKGQIKVINQIEKRVNRNLFNLSTVTQVNDYESDSRICLTSVHLPNSKLTKQIRETLIEPLHEISPEHYYYPETSLHMTIKNVRIINDPPNFTEEDIKKAERIFKKTIPNHCRFRVYFYRLLFFPNNLSLMGTTDPELDLLVLDLDQQLNNNGIPDDKKYLNQKYFFCNITLARFISPISETFRKKAKELSNSIIFPPYTIDSVTLLTTNATLRKRRVIGTWKLSENF